MKIHIILFCMALCSSLELGGAKGLSSGVRQGRSNDFRGLLKVSSPSRGLRGSAKQKRLARIRKTRMQIRRSQRLRRKSRKNARLRRTQTLLKGLMLKKRLNSLRVRKMATRAYRKLDDKKPRRLDLGEAGNAGGLNSATKPQGDQPESSIKPPGGQPESPVNTQGGAYSSIDGGIPSAIDISTPELDLSKIEGQSPKDFSASLIQQNSPSLEELYTKLVDALKTFEGCEASGSCVAEKANLLKVISEVKEGLSSAIRHALASDSALYVAVGPSQAEVSVTETLGFLEKLAGALRTPEQRKQFLATLPPGVHKFRGLVTGDSAQAFRGFEKHVEKAGPATARLAVEQVKAYCLTLETLAASEQKGKGAVAVVAHANHSNETPVTAKSVTVSKVISKTVPNTGLDTEKGNVEAGAAKVETGQVVAETSKVETLPKVESPVNVDNSAKAESVAKVETSTPANVEKVGAPTPTNDAKVETSPKVETPANSEKTEKPEISSREKQFKLQLETLLNQDFQQAFQAAVPKSDGDTSAIDAKITFRIFNPSQETETNDPTKFVHLHQKQVHKIRDSSHPGLQLVTEIDVAKPLRSVTYGPDIVLEHDTQSSAPLLRFAPLEIASIQALHPHTGVKPPRPIHKRRVIISKKPAVRKIDFDELEGAPLDEDDLFDSDPRQAARDNSADLFETLQAYRTRPAQPIREQPAPINYEPKPESHRFVPNFFDSSDLDEDPNSDFDLFSLPPAYQRVNRPCVGVGCVEKVDLLAAKRQDIPDRFSSIFSQALPTAQKVESDELERISSEKTRIHSDIDAFSKTQNVKNFVDTQHIKQLDAAQSKPILSAPITDQHIQDSKDLLGGSSGAQDFLSHLIQMKAAMKDSEASKPEPQTPQKNTISTGWLSPDVFKQKNLL